MGEGTWILLSLVWADVVGREDMAVNDDDDVINLDDDEDDEDEAEANDRLERPEGGRAKIFGLGVMDPGVFGCVDVGDDGVD